MAIVGPGENTMKETTARQLAKEPNLAGMFLGWSSMVIYKVSVFRSSRIFNMAARANNML
jgi:hypothetical protein